ncbi:hypothetical protein [Rosistilla oblonga]|uniref:hypothetical protein n=1 Tax=Rosistilla oblonga TaxID=2527990 RepID=UPI003A98294C
MVTIIVGSDIADVFDAGAGDTRSKEEPATINSRRRRNDHIDGGKGNDVIDGGKERHLVGGDGNDKIEGGDGADRHRWWS